jgi:hypothetical protein
MAGLGYTRIIEFAEPLTRRRGSALERYAASHAMRKPVVVKLTLGLLIIAALLFWHSQNHPSDSVIRQKLQGRWVANIGGGRSGTFAMNLDGHWTATLTDRSRTGRADGTWLVRDSFLITTMTNNNLGMKVPHTDSARITRINSHEFILQVRNTQVVYERIEP